LFEYQHHKLHGYSFLSVFKELPKTWCTFAAIKKRKTMQPTNNQKALVTGATKGIGRAIAEKLAASGYDLVVSARDMGALETLKSMLESRHAGISVTPYACDFRDSIQRKEFVRWIDLHYAQIDVLINNAGIFKPVSLLDESDEDFTDQMSVNYYTAHLLARTVGRNMRKHRKGHIFMVSSIASREPVAAAGTYTVTKYAVSGLTHVLRDELRQHDVKVTEIIPGSTLTSSWAGTTIPSERFILPADIAEAVLTCLRMSKGASVEQIVIKPRYGNI
jgi:Short-chain dehydrogenases of various substrate specificities